jgi:cell division topological specificity factor MinE
MAPSMGLMDVIKRLLYGDEQKEQKVVGASNKAISRLQVVLASDRTGLDELTMAKIRMEIKNVISKYVCIDDDAVEFNLHADDQLTLVTATFPLKGRLIPQPIGARRQSVVKSSARLPQHLLSEA